MESFNLTQYFLEGFTHTRLAKDDVSPLLAKIEAENFVQTTAIPLPEQLKLKASWDDAALPKHPLWDASAGSMQFQAHKSSVPYYLSETAGDLAQSGYYDWFTKIYGQFTQRTVMVNKWERGSGLGWFLNPKLGVFLQSILFLSRHEYEEQDGGSMVVGVCDSDEDGKPVEHTDLELETIQPQNGTLVTLYNMNPNVIYRLNPLLADKEFYTVHFCLGYVENTIMRETALV